MPNPQKTRGPQPRNHPETGSKPAETPLIPYAYQTENQKGFLQQRLLALNTSLTSYGMALRKASVDLTRAGFCSPMPLPRACGCGGQEMRRDPLHFDKEALRRLASAWNSGAEIWELAWRFNRPPGDIRQRLSDLLASGVELRPIPAERQVDKVTRIGNCIKAALKSRFYVADNAGTPLQPGELIGAIAIKARR